MKKLPRAAIKIDFGTEVRLGSGKVRLLELIAETGSISAAARQMEMSYRRAWLLIDEVNGIFGSPVVETATGGTGGGGARITPLGEAVVAAFRDIERNATDLVQTKLAKLLSKRGRVRREA
ncbi:MAG: LysR family transcriptional regulator [Hyphomicrobiales bacterium]|nr:LysR family transcriptional regulator [Hyphomicrobiales bacterium]